MVKMLCYFMISHNRKGPANAAGPFWFASVCGDEETKTALAAALCSAGAVRLFFGVQMQEVLTS